MKHTAAGVQTAEHAAGAAFGLYVHWPYCESKCPYCDFNSHVAQRVDHDTWRSALVTALFRSAEDLGRRTLSSIFFGGGTPSTMQPETVAAVIDAAQRRFTFSNDIEISLEANPGSSDAGRFAEYSIAGVNRLSIGVQALDDGDLRRLGRQHSVRDGLSAVDAALRSVPRVSFDLIYARQDQTPDQWAKELAVALSLGTEHLSLYQLTIEPETQFGRRHARNRLPGLPDDDRAADMFAITQNMTANSGFPAYETSNHARGGAECRHNLIYWRSGDWLGIGPGAHGRLSAPAGRLATEHIRSPAAWLADIAAGGLGEAERTPVDRHDAGEERLMMGLRLVEGVPIAALDGLDGSPRFAASCRALVDSGHLELEAGHLRLTTQGRPLLDAVLRQLLV